MQNERELNGTRKLNINDFSENFFVQSKWDLMFENDETSKKLTSGGGRAAYLALESKLNTMGSQ